MSWGSLPGEKDHGQTWKQAKVPTQNLLTAVNFPSPSKGWAVGHEAVILATQDGGDSWEVQFGDPYDPEAEIDYDQPDRSGQPMLDVWFKICHSITNLNYSTTNIVIIIHYWYLPLLSLNFITMGTLYRTILKKPIIPLRIP